MSAFDLSIQLPVHERFLTFQGEGSWMGVRAFFIRLLGCPVQCPWCDSAGTWHPDFYPKAPNRMEVGALVKEVKASRAELVVITGGEPCIHKNLHHLVSALQAEAEVRVHVETCGAFDQPLSLFDWITVSPKWARLPTYEMLMRARACELKLIVDAPDAIDRWLTALREIGGDRLGIGTPIGPTIWLHPEWSKRNDPEILNAITQAVVTFGEPFRAGYQLHKLYRCDALDTRTAPLAPLGGDPANGF